MGESVRNGAAVADDPFDIDLRVLRPEVVPDAWMSRFPSQGCPTRPLCGPTESPTWASTCGGGPQSGNPCKCF